MLPAPTTSASESQSAISWKCTSVKRNAVNPRLGFAENRQDGPGMPRRALRECRRRDPRHDVGISREPAVP